MSAAGERWRSLPTYAKVASIVAFVAFVAALVVRAGFLEDALPMVSGAGARSEPETAKRIASRLGLVALAAALVALWPRGRTLAPPLLRALLDGEGGSGDPAEVLRSIAGELRTARVEHDGLSGAFRDRTLRIRVLRGGFLGRRYEITLGTALGAPRDGRVESPEHLQALLGVATPTTPFAHSLLEHQVEWQALARIYHVSSVEFRENVVVARASWGGGVLPAVDEAQRIVRLLDRLAIVSSGASVELKARVSLDERCPYCHDTFSALRDTQQCPGCRTRHHAECYRELGRCAIFGCTSRVRAVIRLP